MTDWTNRRMWSTMADFETYQEYQRIEDYEEDSPPGEEDLLIHVPEGLKGIDVILSVFIQVPCTSSIHSEWLASGAERCGGTLMSVRFSHLLIQTNQLSRSSINTTIKGFYLFINLFMTDWKNQSHATQTLYCIFCVHLKKKKIWVLVFCFFSRFLAPYQEPWQFLHSNILPKFLCFWCVFFFLIYKWSGTIEHLIPSCFLSDYSLTQFAYIYHFHQKNGFACMLLSEFFELV